jgi:hypothetical protein
MSDLTPAVREKLFPTAAKAGLTEDDPLYAVLAAQSEMLKAFLDTLPATNGSQPADLKLSQLSDLIKRTEALAMSVKSLPRREDIEKLLGVAGLKENPDLTAFLEEWRITKSQESSPKSAVTRWLGQVAMMAVIAFIVFGAGYIVCWIHLRKDVDARVDRIIDAQQSAYRVPLFLAAHQGSIALGPLKPAEGHNESQGIIIRPGDLKLAQSWVSTDGATVVPLQ